MLSDSDERKDDDDRENRDCVNAILNYLAEHPSASDTLEGITEWWVMRYHVRVETRRVAEVLKKLTESGHLEKIGGGKNPTYRLKTTEREPDERRVDFLG